MFVNHHSTTKYVSLKATDKTAIKLFYLISLALEQVFTFLDINCGKTLQVFSDHSSINTYLNIYIDLLTSVRNIFMENTTTIDTCT